ncbi:MAG TPA: tRNA (adenosine(37)-N6)-threonylcarbamoyltransferase complex dimerization subunit type 1 TsaB [Verrucomicrobiae bacterium]|nr:tRNA (adenosine(37)-N6)-threonylcarbamoyltransferase complex dimerization subunit type 1 TsaB [Verrucomicrobiae bacterium]
MTILALEFSSSQRSVAVARNGEVLAQTAETGERGTNAFGMIETILASAKIGRGEIECVAVGLGPGSYTGIRVALSIAQGWQLASGVKLLGIGSVECLVTQAQAQKMFGRVNVVIDAQRGEFYLAAFEVFAEGIKEVEPLRIRPAAEARAIVNEGGIVAGPEVTRWFAAGRDIFPQAATLATLAALRGDFMAGEKLAPVYLRETTFVKAPPVRSVG